MQNYSVSPLPGREMILPMKRFFTILLFACCTLAWTVPALGLKVAVFPVDDLSRGYNAVNEDLTGFLGERLRAKGLEVVPEKAVESFMAANRIRTLGTLRTKEVLAARDELGADLVLLATLCQQDARKLSMGMNLVLIRTSDGRTVWTAADGVSRMSAQGLLGRATPATMEQLTDRLGDRLFATWPTALDRTADRAAAARQYAAVREAGYLQVDSVFFRPKYVRPGDKVQCVIRFRNNLADEDGPKVFIKVGNRLHLAQSADGKYFKAAWVGSDKKAGRRVNVAMNGSDPAILNGVWQGAAQDASYPVSLVLDWPSGKRDESYVGSYVVDGRAPEFAFKLRARRIDGLAAFRTAVKVHVVFKRSEPVVKWRFTVTDAAGKTILTDRGRDEAPEELVWRGQNNRNIRVDPGRYTLKLTVWDRAGNTATAAEDVRLLAPRPEATVRAEQDSHGLKATIASADKVPVVYWKLEFWSRDNRLLATRKGRGLPRAMALDELQGRDLNGIETVLSLRDALGSTARQTMTDVFTHLTPKEPSTDDPAAHSTDDDIWQADF